MRGNILIASPSLLLDSFFSKAIILIVDQTEDGYTGFILNKPLKLKIKEAKGYKVYSGGPVSRDNLYFIYRTQEPIDGSIKVNEDIYWGGNIDKIFKLIEKEVINKINIRFFIGYSGWDKNQLINEIKNKNWIVGENKTGNILGIDHKKHWKTEMKKLGGEFHLWSESPEDPILN